MIIKNWITEGESIPFGFYIKSGVTYDYAYDCWQTQIHRVIDFDGLVSAVISKEIPTKKPTGYWMTFGVNLKIIRLRWRFKSWTKQVLFSWDIKGFKK